MLRVNCPQLWFNFYDLAVEEVLRGPRSMRGLVGIDLVRPMAPDEIAAMSTRHLRGNIEVGRTSFKEVGRALHRRGLAISKATNVDPAIISALSSTRYKDGEWNH